MHREAEGAPIPMETYPSFVLDANFRAIPQSQALLWGNNAAWLCINCGELVGNRTGNTEFLVTCRCGNEYEIHRGINKNGEAHQAEAIGVQLLSVGTISARRGSGPAGGRRTTRRKNPDLLAPRPYPPIDPPASS